MPDVTLTEADEAYAKVYDAMYSARTSSSIVRELYSQAMGDAYPRDVDPASSADWPLLGTMVGALRMHPEVVGCELGGAVKNVIALAVGVTDGMGLGDNAKAALVTRGLAEATRLGIAMGADPLTFAGLAGMGDLVATCSSTLSRNHSFGYRLGQGLTVAEAKKLTTQTAEGVASSKAVSALGRRHAVELPITAAVVDIIHNGQDPKDVVDALMSRTPKPERLAHSGRETEN